MRVCIHRGTHQIGGTCIELESHGKRLVLDIGLPLDAETPENVPLPPVKGFDRPDESLLGIIISHGHADHYGLAPRLCRGVRFFMGQAAHGILEAARPFIPRSPSLEQVTYLVNRKPIDIGPFRLTPFLVDHSAYDAYAVLVEADGKRLFYSGDLRAHGRKAKLFDALLRRPPKDIDVLLMEGTLMGRADETCPSEEDLVPEMTQRMRDTQGLALEHFAADAPLDVNRDRRIGHRPCCCVKLVGLPSKAPLIAGHFNAILKSFATPIACDSPVALVALASR